MAREAREAAGLRQIDIAVAAGVSHAVVSNLERAVRWPRDPDQIVAAYETECGLERDELWRRAVAGLPQNDEDPPPPKQ